MNTILSIIKNSVLFFIVVIFLFAGCEKKYEFEIVGTWKRMLVDKPGSYDTEIWAFSSSGKVYRSFNGIPLDSGNYNMRFKTLNTETFINITGLRSFQGMASSDNGEYKIHNLDRSKLTMQRVSTPDGSSPYLYREFEKK